MRFFKILSPFVLTMLYKNKDVDVPSQHKRCNSCSYVVVENLVIFETPLLRLWSLLQLPLLKLTVQTVVATPTTTTPSAHPFYKSHCRPLLQPATSHRSTIQLSPGIR
jgi:hypothetical protein